MKKPRKNRAERRRKAAEQPSEPQGLQLIQRVDHDTHMVNLVSTILDKHREIAEAQERLQRDLGVVLYVDKFKFQPNVPLGTRLFWLHRNAQDLKSDDAMERRNIVMLAGGTDMPQRVHELVKEFAEEV